jgi:UDP-3-O-acyl-N-acetylglucosamine deacetylase
MLRQRTLKNKIKSTGVGLHTGVRVELMLRPAPPDSGIVFHRTDLPKPVTIVADARNVGDTRLSSSVEKDGARISTVEHLMSALGGLGIDNLHVAGPEIPIMDGSAGPLKSLRRSDCRAVGARGESSGRRGAARRQVGGRVITIHADFTIDFAPVFGSKTPCGTDC